jgi:hypothetical protein
VTQDRVMYESPLTGFAGAGFGLAVRVAPDGGGGGGGAGESLTVDPDGGVGAGTGVAVGAGVAVAVGVAQLITLHSALATCDGAASQRPAGCPHRRVGMRYQREPASPLESRN